VARGNPRRPGAVGEAEGKGRCVLVAECRRCVTEHETLLEQALAAQRFVAQRFAWGRFVGQRFLSKPLVEREVQQSEDRPGTITRLEVLKAGERCVSTQIG
jgi:hypothetical protein